MSSQFRICLSGYLDLFDILDIAVETFGHASEGSEVTVGVFPASPQLAVRQIAIRTYSTVPNC
jgi:hypothetical protein